MNPCSANPFISVQDRSLAKLVEQAAKECHALPVPRHLLVVRVALVVCEILAGEVDKTSSARSRNFMQNAYGFARG